jgi:uncharacterized protein (TIGR03437 family)
VTIGSTGSNDAGVTSSGDPITYTIGTPNYSVDTTGSRTGWLSVTGGTTTPTSLHFSIGTTSGVNPGAQATVTLTPTAPAGVAAVTITVTFNGTGGGGGGGSSTLTPSQTSVTLPGNGSVVISTTSASAISISANVQQSSCGNVNWLGFQLPVTTVSSVQTSTLTVTANSSGLTNGQVCQGSVIVTPSSGTPLTIPVTFTVNGSGSGGWTVNPSTVSLNFTTNSGNFPSAQVTATTPTGTAYSIATSSTGNWLFANAGSANSGSSFFLQISGNANSLATGIYQGTAVLTDAFNNQFTIQATLNVNGGTTSGLFISPNPVTFNAAVNGAVQSQLITVSSNTTGGAVTLSVNGTPATWLSYTNPSPANVVVNQSSTFTLTANPNGLAAGTYTAAPITVTLGTLTGTLSVSLVVGGGGGGGGSTAVSPTAMSFSFQQGSTTIVPPQKLVITGPAGAWTSVITTSNSGTWLRLTPSSGNSLPDLTNPNAIPVVTVDPTGLAVGTYTGTIAVTTPGGTQNVSVTLSVVSGAILVPNPGSLYYSAQTGQGNPANQTVFFGASNSSLNPISITAVSNANWISLVSTGSAFVTVGVDQTGLNTGTYSGSITVTQTGAVNSPLTIPVVLVVNGGGSGGSGNLTFSPSSMSFTSSNGSTPGAQTLQVSANSTTTFVGSISYVSSATGWLTVNPSSGVTNAVLSVSVNPAGLGTGTYSANIAFNANGSVQNVPVTLTVNGGGNTGNVSVSPTTLAFSTAQGASPQAQSVSVSSTSGATGVAFTVQVTSGSAWLSTSAITNPTTPYTFQVTVNSSSMAAGTYSGNIQITPTGGSIVNIPVSLTITAPPSVSASPTSLTFNYRAGDAAPASQPITVSGSGSAALGFTATASSTGNWLVVSPTSGTTPATVNASINIAGLTTGTYNGTILVAGSGGAPGSTTVNVTLNVTAPLPTITKVTNAASYATGAIAPGEIITLFAGDPTHPIGPATPAGLTLDSSGKVATTIGGVQVLINGFASPMIYASASQVSAVVPYELKLFTTATISIKYLGQTSNFVSTNVTTTSPGIFTANSSGTGPGAILNSNLSLNSSSNAAARGDTVVVYMTGEGETSPAGVTGKVTTVSSTPPLTPTPLLPISITVGGQAANYSFAGEAPGLVSGVLQLNVVLPTNIAAGDQPIVVTIGGNPSQQGVTVSVK